MTPQMRELFLKELELNGVNLTQPSWMSSEEVIREISEALMPEIHEGKVSSFGAIFAESLSDYDQYERIELAMDQVETARLLADGVEWFIFFSSGSIQGSDSFQCFCSK